MSNSQSLAERVEQLEAREAIQQLKARYARGADAVLNDPGTASATALADLFTDDGVLDLGPFGRYEGRAALLNAFENVLPAATKWSTHYIMSPLLEVGGANATGTWYYLIQMLPADPPDAPLTAIYGSYTDSYEKVGAVWKIKQSVSAFFVPPT
jgi:hypothetical protein